MAGAGGGSRSGQGEAFGRLLDELEADVATACGRREEWPAQVGAGIYAGVDFAIGHPSVVDALLVLETTEKSPTSGYTGMIERLARLISRDAPEGSRLPGSTDEALVAGIVGLVGDHVRVGRFEALEALRPDLVLIALLPYLGFEEAREWANRFAADEGSC
ncbi:MAG TPA: hypothetical protein VMF55_07125 [Solirubrobacterales bacterium]|nr:hypothetical protein [Solirubrobacterales bacterium]